MKTNEISAVLLAGGKSSRMGMNKLMMPLGGRPVIGHLIQTVSELFAEVIVVTDEPEVYREFPVLAIRDLVRCPQRNSLAGIHAGLVVAQSPYAFVAGGDMPFIRPDLLHHLCSRADGYEVAIPREGQYVQPLCAVYHKNCIPAIEKLLLNNAYKIADFFPKVRVRYVEDQELFRYDPELISFFNINTPEDYTRAQELIKKNCNRRESK